MFATARHAVAAVLAALSLAPGAAPPAVPAEVVTVAADYRAVTGTLDKDRLFNVSQGGYHALRNLHALPDHAPALAELGMRRVRVDHVFDDDFYGVVSVRDGVTSYDFDRLDDVLLPLLEQGLTPWISLSYMPRALAKDPSTIFSPPKDDAEWGRAVKAMVGHYAALGHTGWYWEVWNEPDIVPKDFWTGTADDYLRMYRATAAAVKSADPDARVGGPGLMSAESGLLGPWLDFLAANRDVACDFVSWHDYGPADFRSADVIRTELARRGLQGKKLYVTEWHAGFRMDNGAGAWSDTHQSASYAAQRMAEAFGAGAPDGVFFFTGLEGMYPRRDFNGDLGLFTVTGRRKAVANAFAMVQSMGTRRLSTGPPGDRPADAYGLITSDPAKQEVSVLLWNNTATARTFAASVDGLPYAQNVSVTRQDVDATAGNSWADHAAGISAQRPGPNELLRPSSRTVERPTGRWTASLTLEPNATTLITLAPTTEAIGAKPVPPAATTVNLARDKAVTASSQYTDEGWSPEAAVDGRRHSHAAADAGGPTMGWTSKEHASATAGEYLQVDLGSPQVFDTVTLWPRDDQAGDGRGFPTAFTIAASPDGTAWHSLVTRTGYQAGKQVSGPQSFPIGTPRPYRYVRVSASALGLPLTEGNREVHRFQLAELEVTKRAANVAVPDPGFERAVTGWRMTGNAALAAGGARSGKRAATFAGAGNGVNVTVTGLTPATTYTFAGHLRSGQRDDVVHLGAKDFGGDEISFPVGATEYAPASVTFTTGPAHTSATLYAYKNSGTARAWFDDFTLIQH